MILHFCDGIFMAKTLEPVDVRAKQTVKFKPGRLLRQGLESSPHVSEDTSVLR